MFGYVRPMRAELKVREFEAYRSCYCGLCRVLKEEYGARARMVLNYDFTFLAMLLWEPDVPFEIRKDRCAVMPCRKHCACRTGESLRLSAGYSVILAWWKLCDTVEDEGLFKALAARGARLWIRRAYRKAREQFPAFDALTGVEMTAGEHEITMRYIPPGFLPGLALTAAGILLWLLYCRYIQKKRKEREEYVARLIERLNEEKDKNQNNL